MTPRHQRPTTLKRFLFGAAYYPEHWPRDWIDEDARRMANAAVNTVRMAEFAWTEIEPGRGAFDFSLFDDAISVLARYDIDTILCTPTATPPRWLTYGNDDWMAVDANGVAMAHGSRQHCCTNNPRFREEARRITKAVAEHYADNTRVIGWQTDNELHCHMPECYCHACSEGFRSWLRRRYHDIDTLNRAWGTVFWAQTYQDFDQIPLPAAVRRPAPSNPSHRLDYYRFRSDSAADYQREQVEILRAVNPEWFVTHNGLFSRIDYWDFSEALDFLSVDIYPGFAGDDPARYHRVSFNLQRCRAHTGGFIVPEQQGGAGGQERFAHATPHPGQMRLWAYQSIANGADGILHFRWRTCRFGSEIYWNGIIDHDNVPRRRYEEFTREGSELARIGAAIQGTSVAVEVAVLWENDQLDAHDTYGMGLPGPADHARTIYAELSRRHLPVGLVNARDSFEGLRLIIVPSFALIDTVLASKLRTFAENGGTVVATARTATRDRNNHVIDTAPPGPLADVFGITVDEYGTADPGSLVAASDSSRISCGAGYEILSPTTASTMLSWVGLGIHAATNQPAMTKHDVDNGTAIYVGTCFHEENAVDLVALILSVCPISSLGTAPRNVEITRRHGPGRALAFVLNHNHEPVTVTDLPNGTELISGERCLGRVSLEAFGVAVVEGDRAIGEVDTHRRSSSESSARGTVPAR